MWYPFYVISFLCDILNPQIIKIFTCGKMDHVCSLRVAWILLFSVCKQLSRNIMNMRMWYTCRGVIVASNSTSRCLAICFASSGMPKTWLAWSSDYSHLDRYIKLSFEASRRASPYSPPTVRRQKVKVREVKWKQNKKFRRKGDLRDIEGPYF